MWEEDESLIRRLARQDEGAMGELYDRYAGRIFGVAFHLCGQRQAAEEVVQDVFLSVWREAENYNPARGSVRTWIFAIARNRAIDFVRRRTAKPAVLYPFDASWPVDSTAEYEDVATQAEEAVLISEATRLLAQMPVHYRQPLLLAYFRGLTQREIADVLQIPLGTVKTRMRIAMDRLRQAMNYAEPRPKEEPR